MVYGCSLLNKAVRVATIALYRAVSCLDFQFHSRILFKLIFGNTAKCKAYLIYVSMYVCIFRRFYCLVNNMLIV